MTEEKKQEITQPINDLEKIDQNNEESIAKNQQSRVQESDFAKQKQHDLMTKTPIVKLLFKLSLPSVMSMLISSIYNMADTYFVSQLGTSASAAVGVVFPITAVIQAVGFMLGSGAGSKVSIYLGEGKQEEAERTAVSGAFSSVISGIIIAILCKVFLKDILHLIGATDTILPYAESYATWILLGFPIMCSSFVMNHLLRSQGKNTLSMIGLTAGGILNIILDPIFIFVFDMGIAGAAVATVLSQAVSLVILIMFVMGKHSIVKINIHNISWKFSMYWMIIRIGAPSFFRQALASVTSALLNNRVAIYGDSAVAAFSIVGRVAFLVFAVMLGVGQGFQPIVGYNYGAHNYKRVRSAYKVTLFGGAILMAIVASGTFTFAPGIMALFRPDDSEVIRIGAFNLRLQSVVLPFMAITTTTNMLFQSLAKNKEATFLALTRQGFYFIPLLLILHSLLGLLGLQITQSIADILSMATAIPFAVRFFKKLDVEEQMYAASQGR